jgi:heptosyltransferase-2
MAQPLLARLREKRPDVRLDALAAEWVAPILRRMPEIEEVIAAPFRHGRLDWRTRWRLGRALRARRYDQAMVLPNTWKSALVPFFADIPLRSGYVGESRYGLLNLLYRPPRARAPMAEHYAQLADPPGTPVPETLPETRLRIDASQADATARRFGFAPGAGHDVVFCPGAEYGPAKRWPEAHFAELARELGAQGLRVWMIGSANDAPVCEAIARASGGTATSLAGRTTLEEAIDLVARASCVLSNDSGLMHVAAALGRPLVALFGSSSPEHTPPRAAGARVVWLHIECSPCFARVCPLGHFRCMNGISVPRALEEIRALGVLPSGAP